MGRLERVVCVLIVSAFVIGASVSPASAGVERTFFRQLDNQRFAEAWWQTSSPGSVTYTGVLLIESNREVSLVVAQAITFYTDPTSVRWTETFLPEPVTSGFSYTFDDARLMTASVGAVDLPVTTCVIDLAYEATCAPSTMHLDITWTGEGELERGVYHYAYHGEGATSTEHSVGTRRDAAAAGSLNELTLPSSDMYIGALTDTLSGSVAICIGSDC